jgi:hypothetical protein
MLGLLASTKTSLREDVGSGQVARDQTGIVEPDTEVGQVAEVRLGALSAPGAVLQLADQLLLHLLEFAIVVGPGHRAEPKVPAPLAGCPLQLDLGGKPLGLDFGDPGADDHRVGAGLESCAVAGEAGVALGPLRRVAKEHRRQARQGGQTGLTEFVGILWAPVAHISR